MGTSEERVWHGKHPAPTITTLDALMLHPNQGWRGTRSRLRFSTAALQRQPSRLFAVEYGVNIIRALPTFVVAALMATTAWTSTRAAERVDLLLVLATDVSGSMDKSKFGLQRSGYAAAFSNPRVIEALRGGPGGRVAAAFIEWSGVLQQKVVIDWTVISNDETARQFGDRIVEAPRAFARNGTSISAGIDFGVTQLDRAPYKAHRRVIDVSGDGDNNSGRAPAGARDVAIAKGITINGLVILTEPSSHSYSSHTNPPGGLANYYRNNVIGGAGAFVAVAENFNSFGNAITKKLIAEIAQAEPQQQEDGKRAATTVLAGGPEAH